MIPVQSSRLAQIGWAPVNESQTVGNLHVVFSDGASGYYENVPLDVFREMRDGANSKGSFLHTHVVKQGYRFVNAPTPGASDDE